MKQVVDFARTDSLGCDTILDDIAKVDGMEYTLWDMRSPREHVVSAVTRMEGCGEWQGLDPVLNL